jgi:DNA-binding protein YbaB
MENQMNSQITSEINNKMSQIQSQMNQMQSQMSQIQSQMSQIQSQIQSQMNSLNLNFDGKLKLIQFINNFTIYKTNKSFY